MNRNNPRQSLILASIAVILLSGCIHRNRADTPAVTFQRTILAGADAADALSVALRGANDTVKSLGSSGQLDAAEVADMHGYLADVARANDLALDALQLARTTGDMTSWQATLLKVAQTVKSRGPGAFHLKSANAQAAFTLSINALVAAASAIQGSFGK